MYKSLWGANKGLSANCTWIRVSKYHQVKTKNVKIGRGVRQGCCLSPILCNLPYQGSWWWVWRLRNNRTV